jgi:purine nucleoside phosphorylase
VINRNHHNPSRHTFFENAAVHIEHTTILLRPFAEPAFWKRLAEHALGKAEPTFARGAPVSETGAEIRAYRSGAPIVGMTGAPRTHLAREAQMSYAGVSIVKPRSGMSPSPLTHIEVMDAMNAALPTLAKLFLAAAKNYVDEPNVKRAPQRAGLRAMIMNR